MKRVAAALMAAGLIVISTGCVEDYRRVTQRLHSPPQGYHPYPAHTSEILALQVENGVMADMTLADIHFIPGRPEINALGEYRLHDMVSVLRNFGGSVYLNSESTNKQLIADRLDSIEAYLKTHGLPESPVATGFGYARGISAREGIIILQAMRFQASTKGGGGGGGVGGAGFGGAGGGLGNAAGGATGGVGGGGTSGF